MSGLRLFMAQTLSNLFLHVESATLVGDLRGVAYGVAGRLYAINESTLFVQDFEYTGQGPDAFFLAGTSGSPSTAGTLLPFPFEGTFYETMDQGAPILDRRFAKENVTLTLPPGLRASSLAWFSVYCRRFTANFGDLSFPSGFTLEAPETEAETESKTDRKPQAKLVGDLSSKAYGVGGQVFGIDERTIFVRDFSYTGQGPDAFFLVGTSGSPSTAGTLLPFPFEGVFYETQNQNAPILARRFVNENITLKLPPGLKVSSLAWFSVFCRAFSANFGDVYFPDDFAFPRAESSTQTEPENEPLDPEATTEGDPEEVEITAETEDSRGHSVAEETASESESASDGQTEEEPDAGSESNLASEPEPEREGEPESNPDDSSSNESVVEKEPEVEHSSEPTESESSYGPETENDAAGELQPQFTAQEGSTSETPSDNQGTSPVEDDSLSGTEYEPTTENKHESSPPGEESKTETEYEPEQESKDTLPAEEETQSETEGEPSSETKDTSESEGASKSGTEIEPTSESEDTSAVEQTESQAKYDPTSENKEETYAEEESLSETKTEPTSETEDNVEKSDAEGDPEASNEVESAYEPETDSEEEPYLEDVETQSEHLSESEPSGQAEPESSSQPQPVSETDPEDPYEQETASDSESVAESETETDQETTKTPETEPEPEDDKNNDQDQGSSDSESSPEAKAVSNEGQEVYLGSFTSYKYGIAGRVYRIGETQMNVKEFSYTGGGPDAFFMVGTSGQPKDLGTILPHPFDGKFYGYDDQSIPVLKGRFDKVDITLTLPQEVEASSVTWISVWCRQYRINFGDLMIAAESNPQDEPEGTPEQEGSRSESEGTSEVESNAEGSDGATSESGSESEGAASETSDRSEVSNVSVVRKEEEFLSSPVIGTGSIFAAFLLTSTPTFAPVLVIPASLLWFMDYIEMIDI